MATSRSWRNPIVGLLFLALGATAATASPNLQMHWSKSSASSIAVVKNADGDVLAETSWGGALPRRYSADEEEAEIPILVLGQLRDQLYDSSQPEAGEALGFVRELMELYADTPVEQLPPALGTWVAYGTYAAEEWCGTAIDSYGECHTPGNPALQNAVCTGFPCKRTTLSPAE